MPRGTNLEGQLLFQDPVLLDLAQALQFSHLLGIQPELSPAYRKQPLASFLAPPRQHQGMDSRRFSHLPDLEAQSAWEMQTLTLRLECMLMPFRLMTIEPRRHGTP